MALDPKLLEPERALVVLVAEDGQVENRVLSVTAGLPTSALSEASNFLNARIRGHTLDEVKAAAVGQLDIQQQDRRAQGEQRRLGRRQCRGPAHDDRLAPNVGEVELSQRFRILDQENQGLGLGGHDGGAAPSRERRHTPEPDIAAVNFLQSGRAPSRPRVLTAGVKCGHARASVCRPVRSCRPPGRDPGLHGVRCSSAARAASRPARVAVGAASGCQPGPGHAGA